MLWCLQPLGSGNFCSEPPISQKAHLRSCREATCTANNLQGPAMWRNACSAQPQCIQAGLDLKGKSMGSCHTQMSRQKDTHAIWTSFIAG